VHLEGVEVRQLHLGLRTPVGTASGTHRSRRLLLVRIVTDTGEGWGECGAMDGGAPSDPVLDEVRGFLTGTGMARLIEAAHRRGGDLPPAPVVSRLFGSGGCSQTVGAVLEMAVLDAELRASGGSLADRLGATGVPVAAGAVVGIPADRLIPTLVANVGSVVGRGYRRVRLKIEPGWDVAPVRAVREAYPELAVQADANGSYVLDPDDPTAPSSARRLEGLDGTGLTCVEQPLAPSDLVGHAELARRLDTPIALDESLSSPRRLNEAISYGACEVACLKPPRLGGLLAARAAQRTCLDAGIPAFVGGFFETGFARSAHAALAGLPGFTLPGDLSDPADYLVDDPCGRRVAVDGLAYPWEGPGIGPVPGPGSLERLTEECWSTVPGAGRSLPGRPDRPTDGAPA
jgi:O-succinylbenzoate synthase